MKLRHSKRNQDGFSMVEILVAAAMLGALAVGSMKYFQTQVKGQKTVEQKYDMVTFVNEIRSFLTHEDNCSKNFFGRNLPYEVTPVQLIDATGAVKYQAGTKYGNGNLEIDSITLGDTSMGYLPFDAIDGKLRNGITALVIRVKRIGKTYAGDTIGQQIKINTRLSMDYPLGTVTTCNAYSVGGFGFWTPSTNGMGIFYQSRVGILTDNPKSLVEIGKQIDVHTPVLSVNAEDIQGRTGVPGRVAMRIKAGTTNTGLPAPALIVHQSSGEELINVSGGGNIQIGSQIDGHTPLLSVNADAIANLRPSIPGLVAMRIKATEKAGVVSPALIIHQAGPTSEELVRFSGGGNIQIGPRILGHTPLLSVNAQGMANIRGGGTFGIVGMRIMANTFAGKPTAALIIHQADGQDLIKFSGGGNIQVGPQIGAHTPLMSINAAGVANIRPDITGIVGLRIKAAEDSSVAIFENFGGDEVFRIHSDNMTYVKKSLNVVGQGAGKNVMETFKSSGGSSLLTVEESGNVKIENNLEIKKDLKVIGNVEANKYTAMSDERLKQNIELITSPLDKLLRLRGVTYNWREQYGFDSIPKQMGLIAQDVQKVFPMAVHENKNGELSVDYNAMVAPLVESVKILSQQIEELRAEIKTLKNQKIRE